jgi:hypothetical protein
MIVSTVTSAFLPRDRHIRRYRYWPSHKQHPVLEMPCAGH